MGRGRSFHVRDVEVEEGTAGGNIVGVLARLRVVTFGLATPREPRPCLSVFPLELAASMLAKTSSPCCAIAARSIAAVLG